MNPARRHAPITFALGIDAGGTQTCGALVDSAGEIAGEGEVRGFSALRARGADRPSVVACSGHRAAARLALHATFG